MNRQIDTTSAIQLLKAGGTLDKVIVSDLATTKVKVMDALLLAENGCVVPDGNIVYDDNDIQPDPDFDDTTWGQPVSFKQIRQTWEGGAQPAETAELVVKLQVKNVDMKQWLAKNEAQITLVVSGLLESMYQAEKLSKP